MKPIAYDGVHLRGMRVRDRLTGATGTVLRGNVTDYDLIIHFDGAPNPTVWRWSPVALIPVTA